MGRFFIAVFLFLTMLNVGDVALRLKEIRDLMTPATDKRTCTMMVVSVPDGTATICADRLGH